VRITVNVVQAEPERHLWAESYEFDQQDSSPCRAMWPGRGRQIWSKLMPQDQPRLARPNVSIRKPTKPTFWSRLLLQGEMARARTSWTRAKEYFESD